MLRRKVSVLEKPVPSKREGGNEQGTKTPEKEETRVRVSGKDLG